VQESWKEQVAIVAVAKFCLPTLIDISGVTLIKVCVNTRNISCGILNGDIGIFASIFYASRVFTMILLLLVKKSSNLEQKSQICLFNVRFSFSL